MEYVKEQLDNGLRAVYVPMEGTKTVTVLVLVNAGSRHEEKSINGISHFLEHLAFKGTAKRPDKISIAQELDAIGAHYNAYTGQEYTGYWVKVDMKHTELALDIVSDIFLHSTLPQEEIERERGVILGEIDLQQDMPMRQAWYTFNELVLGDQPSGWSVLGPKDNIKTLNRDDFLNYREKHYRTPNIVVVVAGNFQIETTRKVVERLFKGTPVGDTPQAQAATWEQSEPRLAVGSKKFDQAHLLLGTWAFDYHDERKYALELLKTVLGSSMSSRLFLKIREELGLGYYVRGDTSLYDDYGFFEVQAGVDAARIEEAVAAVVGELKRVCDDVVEDKELKKARDYIRGTMLIDLESSDSVAEYFADQELLEGEILTPEQYFSKLEQITPGEVKRVAQDIFTNERLNLAVVGPVTDEESIKKILTF